MKPYVSWWRCHRCKLKMMLTVEVAFRQASELMEDNAALKLGTAGLSVCHGQQRIIVVSEATKEFIEDGSASSVVFNFDQCETTSARKPAS